MPSSSTISAAASEVRRETLEGTGPVPQKQSRTGQTAGGRHSSLPRRASNGSLQWMMTSTEHKVSRMLVMHTATALIQSAAVPSMGGRSSSSCVQTSTGTV